MAKRKTRKRRASRNLPVLSGGMTDPKKPGRLYGIHWVWWAFFIVPAAAYGISTVLRGPRYYEGG